MRKLITVLLMSLILAVAVMAVAEVQEGRQDVSIGDIVHFGRYEQDNNTANGAESIEWLVLDYDEVSHRILLISRYALDTQPYNETFENVTWETCSLRAWLNAQFLPAAFSAEEQAAILPMNEGENSTQDNSGTGFADESDTLGQVFLLSYAEARQYFDSEEDRRCVPTTYAVARGGRISSYYTADGQPTGWWWTRLPGNESKYTIYVHAAGGGDYIDVNWPGSLVRPALWLDLNYAAVWGMDGTRNVSDNTSENDYAAVVPGDIITFGAYEQDNNPANGPESIEWVVLDYDKSNHRALLLSRYGLDARPYNTEYADITWETCTLRSWLNDEFLNNAFSKEEQSAILLTEVDNSSGQGYSEWNTSGGNNTQDRVFLLSYAEAYKYLDVTTENENNTGSRVAPTDYAMQNGAWTSDSYKTADGAAAGWWWLRSPGYDRDYAADVGNTGSLICDFVNYDDGCVRPAFLLNLESGIF